MEIPKELELLRKIYKKQRYHFVGVQAVVKPCYWMKKSLLTKGKEFCYKQLWYGIPSHRCLQMSPVIICNFQCLYCWRAHEIDFGLSPLFSPEKVKELPFDKPHDIVINSIKEWKKILTGYKGNPKVDKKMLEEAMHPIHVTFSLTGEPTLYPYLSELVEEYFNYGFKSVFIVSNGSSPEALANLSKEPSQLYITLPAFNEKLFKIITRPLISKAWQSLMKSLELLNSFHCPTVIRLTLVKNYSLQKPDEYAKVIQKFNPTYVEVKAAMNVGFFRKRLKKENMPSHTEIKRFAIEKKKSLSYNILGEQPKSRVVLISSLKKPIKIINQ